jgi:hypothetical protein
LRAFFTRQLRSRCEPVAERAAWRALHQGLVAREADLAAAGCNDIEIGGADQQRAELRLAERAKEFREAAVRDIEFQRLLVVRVRSSRGSFHVATRLRQAIPAVRS